MSLKEFQAIRSRHQNEINQLMADLNSRGAGLNERTTAIFALARRQDEEVAAAQKKFIANFQGIAVA